MLDSRRIGRFFGVSALFVLCLGLVGGVLGIADAAFELGFGKWLFETSAGNAIGPVIVGVCFIVFLKTFFPHFLDDLRHVKDPQDIQMRKDDSIDRGPWPRHVHGTANNLRQPAQACPHRRRKCSR